MIRETTTNLFNNHEMEQYGFDPDNELDREEWLKTTAPNGIPKVIDYSQDAEAFGSVKSTAALSQE